MVLPSPRQSRATRRCALMSVATFELTCFSTRTRREVLAAFGYPEVTAHRIGRSPAGASMIGVVTGESTHLYSWPEACTDGGNTSKPALPRTSMAPDLPRPAAFSTG